jgi:hypothetical protein
MESKNTVTFEVTLLFSNFYFRIPTDCYWQLQLTAPTDCYWQLQLTAPSDLLTAPPDLLTATPSTQYADIARFWTEVWTGTAPFTVVRLTTALTGCCDRRTFIVSVAKNRLISRFTGGIGADVVLMSVRYTSTKYSFAYLLIQLAIEAPLGFRKLAVE